MFSMKLLLTFSLLTGIVAEECTADLGIDDFTDRVVVTNAPGGVDAAVTVAFDHGKVSMIVPPGKSRTATGLAATRYTVTVIGSDLSDRVSYRKRLIDLRDELFDLSVSAYVGPDQILTVWAEIANVQAALDQMKTSADAQSCASKLTSGEPSQVALEWRDAIVGEHIWVLDCG
jgi:hypothetical protein